MKDKDYIKELFSEKLSNHEVPVRSDLWAGIQSQIGNTATTAAAAKGISVAAKWAIGIASSVVVAGSVAWFALDGQTERKAEQQLSKVEQENVLAQPEVSKDTDPASVSDPKAASNAVAAGNVSAVKDGTFRSGESATGKNNGIETNNNHVPLILFPATSQPEIENKATAGVPEKPAAIENKVILNSGETSKPLAAEQPKVVGEIVEWKKTNVFSPNGDRINDVFFLETKNLKEFQITIYNNLTKKTVFTSSDPDFKWYGEDAPDGSYGYVVIAVDENGNRIAMANELIISR